MKRTIATLMAAGLILPIAGVVTASQLQAQAKTSAIGSILAQTDDRPTRSERDEPGEHLERLAADLGLTEDQVAQMRTIREANQEEMQALRENIRTERETLQALMAGEASEAELRSQYETVQALHQEATDKRFEIMLATREILTPEQRTELAERIQQRRDEFRENRGFRGDREGVGSDR